MLTILLIILICKKCEISTSLKNKFHVSAFLNLKLPETNSVNLPRTMEQAEYIEEFSMKDLDGKITNTEPTIIITNYNPKPEHEETVM